MISARDLIQAAFEELQVYSPGETALDADAARGFKTLNDLVDSWSNESLTCYAINQQSAPLVPGKYQYTIGEGGDFNMQRPLRIIAGVGRAYILDDNGNKYLVSVVPQDVYNWQSQNNINSNFPDTLFYDPQFPLGIINIFPVPNISYTIFWESYLQLTEFASLAATLNLPPGYERAFKKNLAVELAPFYPTAVLSQATIAQAARALGNIKRTNTRPLVATYDSEIVAHGSYSYNIRTDSNA